MKKSIALAFGFAMLAGSAMAQNAQEITYVEDPSQGYLFNRFRDNWFIQGEGGVTIGFTDEDNHRKLFDRLTPSAHLYVGKWFSPLLGVRIGASYVSVKGLSNDPNCVGLQPWEGKTEDGFWKTYQNYFGPSFSVMLNLTNWWCGYRPGRVYNAIVYGGAGLNWQYVPDFDSNGNRDGWKNGSNKNLTAHVGLINNFALNKHLSLYLDVRAALMTDDLRYAGSLSAYQQKQYMDLQAYLGLTYNFNKTTWSAPVVPVCPEPTNCDAVEARLQAANARISDLERQLRDCLNRPVEKVEAKEGPLCTIYYTIGKSNISRVDNKVLGAVAEIMKQNPEQKYTVTGWADNYTGSDQVNERLRNARAKGVERVLLRNGVNASQLNVTVNNGNLNDMGEKFVSLDRAVTIEADK